MTSYTSDTGLNDGRPHVVTYVRVGDTVSVFVDDEEPTLVGGGGAGPRGEFDVRFGSQLFAVFGYTGDISEIRFYDGQLTTEEVLVIQEELRVRYTNVPPVAAAEDYVVQEDVPLNVLADAGVLANNRDPDGDAFTAVLVAPPRNGQITLGTDGGLSSPLMPTSWDKMFSLASPMTDFSPEKQL